jgi:hypothetical protein
MKRAHPRRWRAIVVLVLLVIRGSLSAHPVVVEQVVDVALQPQRDVLVVRLHVPAVVAGDPSLMGLLHGNDAAALERQLQLVAADIARNLDVQQSDATLAPSGATATRAGGETSIDVEVRYPLRSDEQDFSARLNAFSASAGPVRTNARFLPASGREQIVSVEGPAARISFDPQIRDVLPAFALRALRLLFDSGDYFLLLACLLLPLPRGRFLSSVFAATALSQVAAFVVSMAAARTPELDSVVTVVAASTIVIAALQNIARARQRWILAVAIAFGALNGWTMGVSGQSALQFAGAHRAPAMLTFCAVVLLGQLWLGAVAWAFRAWLAERGLHERVTVVVGSALVAHSAVHRLVERAHTTAAPAGDDTLFWLTLTWTVAILLVAGVNAVSGSPARASAS